MSNSLFKCVSFLSPIMMFSRSYSKNILRRRAIRVLNVPAEDGNIAPLRQDDFEPKKQIVRATDKVTENSISTHLRKKTEVMVPPYVKLQKNDARFAKTLTILKNRKLRERKGTLLLEGKRLINDAINVGMNLKTLYFSREEDLLDIKLKDPSNAELCKVMYKTLQVWSDLTTCPGVMGLFKRPTADELYVLSEPVIPVTVICDNIRDPGNLGSIIRNAAAVGCENILLMKGCVDPWETKVLRAGCGGHFRIPILHVEWNQIANYISKDSTIFVADSSADIEDISCTPEFIDFNEGEDENPDEENLDKRYVALNEHMQPVVVDETYNEETALEKFSEMDIPSYLYSSIKYPKKNIVLYVGGETHGVDPRVIKLAFDYGGKKVKIPLENGMDSLNSGFAMTIILYEIRRQLSETYVTK